MIQDLVVGLFIAAARQAARWPEPFRFEAREALTDLPVECFDGELWAMEIN